MATVTVEIDAQTEARLERLSEATGDALSQTASRLLARAARAAAPRPRLDVAAVEADQREFAQDDLNLADSAPEERAALLAHEDAA